MKHLRKYILVLFLVPATLLQAQTKADSLTLSGILNVVMNNYPTLAKAAKELDAANAKISLTKTAYLPDINFSTSYNRIGPVSSITFAGKDLELYPANVYNATISVNQNIYDFGKTAKNVALDEKNKEMVQLTTDQTKQQLSMVVMGSYYSICFLQEAIQIKDD